MPNKPSANGLINAVATYRYTYTQDVDAGVAPWTSGRFTLLQSAAKCSVQPALPEMYHDPATGQVTEMTMWDVFWNVDPGLNVNDKIVWVDFSGASHVLRVHGTASQAGKGAAWVVSAQEWSVPAASLD